MQGTETNTCSTLFVLSIDIDTLVQSRLNIFRVIESRPIYQ
jgi:hypothetical protein